MIVPKPLALAAVQTMLLLADVAWGQCAGKGVERYSYFYQDNVPPSSSSPLNDVGRTPMFLSLSFDDNGSSGLNGVYGGMDWVVQMLAERSHPNGDPVLATFFHTTEYIDEFKKESPVYVKRAWRNAKEAGHEVALHSHTHPRGGSESFSKAQWANEIQTGKDWLTKPFDPSESVKSPDSSKGIGAALGELNGWRTPHLDYNANTMRALKSQGVWYDSSIQDGYQSDYYDGSNYNWPHTLDSGSPAAPHAGTHEGLWEFPVQPCIVPPDSVMPGLRAKCKRIKDSFDVDSGKVTCFDYNLLATYKMTKDEFLATLKYTFDLRYNGNRAPFALGLHSDYYSDSYTPRTMGSTTPAQRRQALTEFVNFVLSKTGVRMVPIREVFHWMRDPIPVECFGTSGGPGPGPSPPTPALPSCPNGLLPLYFPDCRSSPNCCASGAHCYEKNQWWASCRETCSPGERDSHDNYPWSCVKLATGDPPAPPPAEPSCPNGRIPLYEKCQSSPNCCESGAYCYEKNQWYASCKDTCTPGERDSYDHLPWSCVKLTTEPSCPNGRIPLNEKCQSSPNCCESGAYCYEKNQWYASCRHTCTPGETDSYDELPWSCNNLTTGGRRFLRARVAKSDGF